MTGFKGITTSGVRLYTGDPTCDGAHAALLGALKNIGTPFIQPGASINYSQQGNLGEFISLHIGRSGTFAGMQAFAQNAIQPLSAISGAGLDLTFVYFDGASESNDLLFIQEVKTTSAANLNYLKNLETDYEKLFSTDINLTLQSRIQGLANAFELERQNDLYAKRVQRLAAKTPKECSRVRLVPTGVHNLNVGAPVQKLLAIRSAIAGLGWDITSITPWSIALSDIDDRLLRLARGLL